MSADTTDVLSADTTDVLSAETFPQDFAPPSPKWVSAITCNIWLRLNYRPLGSAWFFGTQLWYFQAWGSFLDLQIWIWAGVPFARFSTFGKDAPRRQKMFSGFQVDISGDLPGTFAGVVLTRRPRLSPGRPSPWEAHFSWETKNRKGPPGPPRAPGAPIVGLYNSRSTHGGRPVC